MLSIESSSIITFFGAIVIYSLNSLCDLKTRLVPNTLILGEGLVSVSVLIVTGQVYSQLSLHIISLFTSLSLGYLLFKIGSLGGGDVKTLTVTSLISPGAEFGLLYSAFIEGIMGVCIPLVVALVVGHLYIQYQRSDNQNKLEAQPPLIPYLFAGYLIVQVLGLVI